MRERFQNPIVGDEINLRLFVFNSNRPANVNEIINVEIYKINDVEKTEINPDGRRLVKTIEADDVSLDEDGQYSITFDVDAPTFTIGKYVDIWSIRFEDSDAVSTIENVFEIKRDLWFTDVAPIVHDFEFRFQPNRVVKGSKKYITIEVVPNVPRGTDLDRYYRNMLTVASLKISISMKCGECVPPEEDLRLVVDEADVSFRDAAFGYYFLDTTELDCGLYDVQFSMELGLNAFVSEKQQLLIFS